MSTALKPSTFSIEVSAFPYIISRFAPEVAEAEVEAYLGTFTEKVLRRNSPFVTILDARTGTIVPSPKARHAIGQWTKQHEDELHRLCRGELIIADSGVLAVALKGVATAINWLVPLRTPFAIEGDVQRALSWAEKHLADANALSSPAAKERAAEILSAPLR